MIDRITAIIVNILSKVLIVLMATIVIDVSWQVFTRFILQNPSSFTEELAGFLLIWIGLLGSSYALYTRAHLGIDIMTSKLTGIRKIISETSVWVVVAGFALFVLVIGGLRLVSLTLTLNQISPAMGIPMGYVYLVLPTTGLLMIYFSLVNVYNSLTGEHPDTDFHAGSDLD